MIGISTSMVVEYTVWLFIGITTVVEYGDVNVTRADDY